MRLAATDNIAVIDCAAMADALPIVPFPSADAFEAWLEAEHARVPGVWLQIAKKHSGIATVTYAEALDVALCFGWIDGQKARHDERYFRQRFTPRRRRSTWSKINTEHVARLIEHGRMRPAGLAEVEAAKADGRWAVAYAGQRTATVPEDLQQALDANPAAAACFATLKSANRYAILYGVQSVKRAETRARKIAEYVAMLARGETIHS